MHLPAMISSVEYAFICSTLFVQLQLVIYEKLTSRQASVSSYLMAAHHVVKGNDALRHSPHLAHLHDFE